MTDEIRPWPALWSLVVGFFMILVDSTIVSVAMPAIMSGLDTDITKAVWVTSAYLLAYAVPLLITGRLGDRLGPKNVYLTGLVVFTLSSAWCGLSPTVESLIVSRVVQGLGAALMTPQTMAVITRTFPPDNRGTAMGLWGSVAGVATLVGPVLGGFLVDWLGWEWIFFINLPVGVVGFFLAWRWVPRLRTHRHRFDLLGVVLSAIGMFCLVFGIQEGEGYGWGIIIGPVTVWRLVVAGVVVLIGFVWWQHRNRGEPLLPLTLFADRNFGLANLGIFTMGFAITAMALPIMLFAQVARGFSPTTAALLLAPMSVLSGVLAPFVGRLIDRIDPRPIAVTGFCCMIAGLTVLGTIVSADIPVWQLIAVTLLLGLGNAGIWAPLSTTATRNLPPQRAGAGSGVYNETRQVGAVLGAAAIAAMMNARLASHLPGTGASAGGEAVTRLPQQLREPFAEAMGESLYLPAGLLVIGLASVCFFAPPRRGADNPSWSARD